MAQENKKDATLWQYQITGYYFADGERKRFEEYVYAENNSIAMERVIGKYAWSESLDGKTFKLDVIHYECW